MKNPITTTRLLLLAMVLAFGNSLSAQLTISSMDEQANTTTAGNQFNPAAAQAGNGNTLIVWESDNQDGDGFGIFGQYFGTDGLASGSEFQVNATTAGDQVMADVAMDDAGNAVVVWMDQLKDGNGWGIFGQRFDAAGAPSGSEFLISNTTAGSQRQPSVSMDHDGDYVIAWTAQDGDADGFGVQARMFASSGVASGPEFTVNDSAAGYQGYADVAMDSAGNFAIAWQSQDYDSSGNGIFAKMYDASGTALSSEFMVNTTTSGNQQEPTIGMDNNGQATVAWSSFDASSDLFQVMAASFDQTGTATNAEFAVNGSATEAHDHAHLSVTQEGKFAISYSAYGRDGSYHGVYIQAYDATATADGSEELVNTETNNFQQFSGSAWRLDTLPIALAWQSGLRTGSTTQDGDGYGIFTKQVGNIDTEAPVAVCRNLTLHLYNPATATIAVADVDNGSTDNVGIVSSSIDVNSFDCSTLGAQAVQLIVTDAKNNSDTCTSTVTVVDSVSPDAVCQNVTLSLDANGDATLTAAQVDNGSSDNCGIASTSIDVSSFTCNEVGTNSVLLTVTDNSGNASTCTSTVTVQDNTAPTAACQDLTLNLDGSGTASLVAANLDSGSTDNCGIASMVASQTSFDCISASPTGVSLTVTDAAGNQDVCFSNVTLIDNEAPEVTCQSITASLDATGSYTLSVGDVIATLSDNCGITGTSLSQENFGCSNMGIVPVTVTVEDNSGNQSSCVAQVTVEDNTAPNAICQDVTLALDNSGSATLTTADIDNGSNDNCSLSLSVDTTPYTCADIGTMSAVLIANDPAGNSSICTANLTIEDNTAPTAVCNNGFVTLNSTGTGNLDASDVGSGSSDNCAVSSMTLDREDFDCGDIGTQAVTLTVTDASGNSSTCTANINVSENTAPNAVCNNVTLNLNGSGNATLGVTQVDNGSNDNCGIANISLSKTSFDCGDIGNNNVTLTVTDASGNQDQCTATVNVQDVTAPSLSCPSNATYSCIANVPAASVNDVTVSDNCDSSPNVNLNEINLTSGNIYRRIRMFTAIDNEGNVSNCSQQVVVNVPNSISAGNCVFCLAKVTVTLSASNPARVTLSSCEKIKKVRLIDVNGTQYNLNTNTKNGTWTHPSGLPVKKVRVKAGCSGGTFSHTFNLCNGSSKVEDGGQMAHFPAGLALKAYPNPTNGQIKIELTNEGGEDGESTIQVVDMNGKVLEVRKDIMTNGFQEAEFDLGQFSNGMYYIIVDHAGQRLTEKVIKQ